MKLQMCFVALTFLTFGVMAQVRVVKNPNVAQQTHPEMTIEEIRFYTDSTVIQLIVINKLASGGWFCADKNTFLEDPQSLMRKKIINAVDIPWCPDAHRFSKVNETLRFKLIFPSISAQTELLNLVEQCERACFSFKGIILNDKLNRDINLFNEAMVHYADNKLDEAILLFSRIVEDLPANPTHVYGYSYYHLVRIYWEIGQKDIARLWIQKLEQSGLPNRHYFLENIKRELGTN
jgi:tetratricopeptide (TPR) repeat protein